MTEQEAKSEVVSVRLTPQLLKRVQERAQREDRSVSSLIFLIVRDSLDPK